MLDDKGRYTVVRDTREKVGQGWSYSSSTSCAGTIEKKLNTGDYSLVGYEDLLTIERKGSVTEFAQNIVQARFEKELERLTKFKYKYIILEFAIGKIMNYPQGSGLPPYLMKRARINGNFIMSKIIHYQVTYDIPIIIADQYGKEIASHIFKRVVKNE